MPCDNGNHPVHVWPETGDPFLLFSCEDKCVIPGCKYQQEPCERLCKHIREDHPEMEVFSSTYMYTHHDPSRDPPHSDEESAVITLWRRRQESPREGPQPNGKFAEPMCSKCGEHIAPWHNKPDGLIQCTKCLNFFHCLCHQPMVATIGGILVRGTWKCSDCTSSPSSSDPPPAPKRPSLKILSSRRPPKVLATIQEATAEVQSASMQSSPCVSTSDQDSEADRLFEQDIRRAIANSLETSGGVDPGVGSSKGVRFSNYVEVFSPERKSSIDPWAQVSRAALAGVSTKVAEDKLMQQAIEASRKEIIKQPDDEEMEETSEIEMDTEEIESIDDVPELETDVEEEEKQVEDENDEFERSEKWKGKQPMRDS